MTARSELIERILGLCPEGDAGELHTLTRELVNHRRNPMYEKNRFESVQRRGIAGYGSELLPRWRRVLVTGGTGCVGHILLTNLINELPDAQFASVARRCPDKARELARVAYLQGDVRNIGQMTSIMEGFQPDLVIHLAAQRNPALAEREVAETVTTNIVGSQVVLDAATAAGVNTVVVASTGKAVRLYTTDIYAATKMLVEYQCALAAKRSDAAISCTRFTHVVDNSLVGQNILNWIAADEQIQLHSPLVDLPVQSALECYQLLMTAGVVAERNRPRVVALRDLGWPPIALLDLTLDHLAEHPQSRSAIVFTGYPPGYEAEAYPGTYDPRSAGDVSPLVNCIEASRTTPAPVLGGHVDQFEMTDVFCDDVTSALADIAQACAEGATDNRQFGALLRTASLALFRQRMENAETERIGRIHHFGRRHDPRVDDHATIHEHLKGMLNVEDAVLV